MRYDDDPADEHRDPPRWWPLLLIAILFGAFVCASAALA